MIMAKYWFMYVHVWKVTHPLDCTNSPGDTRDPVWWYQWYLWKDGVQMNAICYIIPCQFSNLRNLTGSARGRIDLYQSSKHPEVQWVALASGFPVIHQEVSKKASKPSTVNSAREFQQNSPRFCVALAAMACALQVEGWEITDEIVRFLFAGTKLSSIVFFIVVEWCVGCSCK